MKPDGAQFAAHAETTGFLHHFKELPSSPLSVLHPIPLSMAKGLAIWHGVTRTAPCCD